MHPAAATATDHALHATAAAPSTGGHTWLAVYSLGRRELVRFLRQRNRVIGALATPVVFWLLIGGGMGRSFVAPGMPGGDDFLRYFFPGSLLMILLFTAIFSTISVIEDRREGFLQGVLIAPVSPAAVALGKVLGGTALAVGQGVLFLLLAPLVGVRLSVAGIVTTIGVMVIVAFLLTSLGLALAWRMRSTQGFHAVMNLLLMPMWFLSGALFPVSGAMGGIGWLMRLNPLTYGLASLRRAIYFGQAPVSGAAGLPSLATGTAITVAFAAVSFAMVAIVARSRGPE